MGQGRLSGWGEERGREADRQKSKKNQRRDRLTGTFKRCTSPGDR